MYYKNSEKNPNVTNNTNNFYSEVHGVQIQQGTSNSSQSQAVLHELSYEKIEEIINKIKKYDSQLDEEYGCNAIDLRNKLNEIENLLQEKGNQNIIKSLLLDIKNLSMNIAGSVIANGIATLIGLG